MRLIEVVRVMLAEVKQRRGKGPWMMWFPKSTQRYISRPIKTKSEMQALGSWFASETEGRDWHNSIFRDYKEVVYRGKKYTKDQGKLLYQAVVGNSDWDGVDLGSPIESTKSKIRASKSEEIVRDLVEGEKM